MSVGRNRKTELDAIELQLKTDGSYRHVLVGKSDHEVYLERVRLYTAMTRTRGLAVVIATERRSKRETHLVISMKADLRVSEMLKISQHNTYKNVLRWAERGLAEDEAGLKLVVGGDYYFGAWAGHGEATVLGLPENPDGETLVRLTEPKKVGYDSIDDCEVHIAKSYEILRFMGAPVHRIVLEKDQQVDVRAEVLSPHNSTITNTGLPDGRMVLESMHPFIVLPMTAGNEPVIKSRLVDPKEDDPA